MRIFSAIVFTAALAAPAAAQPTVADLAWLAGEWMGEGRESEAGPPEGAARLYWTPPTDGVATYLFTWNVPKSGHVHHAISIFRDGEDGVTGHGIHYGRDFRNFEKSPWKLRLASAAERSVTFECVENCRSQTIRFAMIGPEVLEERWLQADRSKPDWIVTYRRADSGLVSGRR